MLNFSDFNIQPLINFLHMHPHAAGFMAFGIVFLEAMAVIGVFIPGIITMPAIGFLIGSAVIPAGSTFAWAIAGALTGDYLSYLLGIFFQNRIHRIWPFTRWPQMLEHSEKFFQKHGGKSVFIGRFVGPTRAMIPMVAGVLKMPLGRFFLAAVPSATLWALSYIIPGVLLGALSLELPPKVATKFTLYMLLAAIAVWAVVWLIQHYFRRIWEMIDYYVMQIWKFCEKKKTLRWITEILADQREPENHKQLILVVMFVLVTGLFFLTLNQVVFSGALTKLNQPIRYLLSSLRTDNLDNIFIMITLLGDSAVLGLTSGFFFLWLLWKKHWYVAAHWLLAMAICVLAVGGAKLLMHLPRPGDVLYAIGTSSFPSAHTALSLAFFGFLAAIIARDLKKNNKCIPYIVAGILVASVSFSRLYLGAHWVSDILGGIFSGLAVVILVTISYRRRHAGGTSSRDMFFVAISIFITVWLSYSMIRFHQKVKMYALIIPEQTALVKDVFTTSFGTQVPLYRHNRLGSPIEAFNLEWIGDIGRIKQSLLNEGWESQPVSLDLQNMVKSFSGTSVIHHLPIFPQLYHNKKPALILTKSVDIDDDSEEVDTVLILRLWQSDIDLKDSDLPLWIGSIEYHRDVGNVFSLEHIKRKKLFVGATEYLVKYLKGFSWKEKKYLIDRQPLEMRGLQWDGKLLVIK